MDAQDLLKVTGILLQYLIPTMEVFAFTLLFSLPLGIIVALLKMCKIKPISWLTNIYILFMRGTPLILQIIIAYYAIPMLSQNSFPGLEKLLSKVNIQSDGYMFWAVIIAFSLNYAAYFAEIFRGGIESIPPGQSEAAFTLGLTKAQTFFKITLPQVFKRILPAMSNEIIILVKDTSLASVVAYAEIFLKAKQQMVFYSSLLPLFVAGLFYFVINGVLTVLFGFIEKKLDYYK